VKMTKSISTKETQITEYIMAQTFMACHDCLAPAAI
jgi:hypothetical protein